MSSSSSSSSSCNLDSLLLQSMMGRLQLRPPYLNANSYLSQESLEDFLHDSIPNYEQEDDDDDDYERTLLSKEESRVEKEIIRVILSGNIETLKPNSGQAVTIGEHHICVGFNQDDTPQSDYRVWEWHGHIMLLDQDNGYAPEYIYGNYFQRLPSSPLLPPALAASAKELNEEYQEDDNNVSNLGGLRELIDATPSTTTAGRILCRNNINAAPTRF